MQSSSGDSDTAKKDSNNGISYLVRLYQSFQTWRGLTLAGLAISCSVALANVIFLIWSLLDRQNVDGLVTLFEGDCHYVGRLNTAMHLIISLFSNLLLGVSNACVQALISPTRQDVDKAHRRGSWLSIGVSSFRNLPYIPLRRSLLCLLLASSSLPLSLLYNSVIIQKLSTYMYRALPVTQNFLTDGPRIINDTSVISVDPFTYAPVANASDCCLQYWNNSATPFSDLNTSIEPTSGCELGQPVSFRVEKPSNCLDSPAAVHYQALADFDLPWFNAASWEILTAQQCAQTYSSFFLSDYSNLLLVSKESNLTSNVPGSTLTISNSLSLGGSPTWICERMNLDSENPEGCDYSKTSQALASGQDWLIFYNMLDVEYPLPADYSNVISVDHCVAAKVPQRCELSMSPIILAIVIFCNFCKICCLLWALLSLDFAPMVTVGDSIQSFLTSKDDSTKYQSSLSVLNVRDGLWNHDPTIEMLHRSLIWTSRRFHWAYAVATSRWILTMVM